MDKRSRIRSEGKGNLFSYLWDFIYFSPSWFKEERHYEIWPYPPSHIHCHYVLSNLPLKFHLRISLFYSHCQGLSSRLRLQLWACISRQVLATFHTAGLVREHHFPHDTPWLKTQAYQIYICLPFYNMAPTQWPIGTPRNSSVILVSMLSPLPFLYGLSL